MYRITGRVDDILIVSGHNLGTAEIESAIDEHPKVCETAIVDFHMILKEMVYAFIICHKIVNENLIRDEINSY